MPAFADTNVVVYAFAKDEVKVAIAEVEKAMEIEAQARISYWDALIVGAALLSGCDILYTEDLETGRKFEGQLAAVNPFAAA